MFFLIGAKMASPSPSIPEVKLSCGGEPGGVLDSPPPEEASPRRLKGGH